MSQYHICIWTGEGLSKCFSVLELAYLSGGTTDMLDIFKRIRYDCDSRLSSALDLAFRMLKKMTTNKQLWILGRTHVVSILDLYTCMSPDACKLGKKAEKV